MSQFIELIKVVAGSSGGSAVITAAFIWFVLWVYGKFVRMTTQHDAFEKNRSSVIE